jgi:hypothetical protein
MDRITLAGNATSPLGGAPVFPAGSFLDTVPMQFSYHVPITLGSGAQQEGLYTILVLEFKPYSLMLAS